MMHAIATDSETKLLSHYHLLETLGQGGMGMVFLAEDLRLGRKVAVKLLPDDIVDDLETRKRFYREGALAARIRHPNVCTVHTIEEDDYGRPFIVMEWLEGRTLSRRIQERLLTAQESVEIGSQIVTGLAAAHTCGIIHRDLKPSNVFLTQLGQVKILDFGLARDTRVLDSKETLSTLIRPGDLCGTLYYMSPEQALGEPMDQRSDLYSVGALLYESLMGEYPFFGATLVGTIDAILHQSPQPMGELKPDIPARLERIVTRLLERKPEDRYQSCHELLIDLCQLKRTGENEERELSMVG